MPRKAAVRPQQPIVPTNTEALRERFKDFPAWNVIERRLLNPEVPGSLPILLKDEDPHACLNSDHQYRLKIGATKCAKCGKPARKWMVRFVNTSQENRWSQIREKGYIPVHVKELMDQQDVADLVESKADTYVRRGDRGQEILVKQPLELYHHLKRLARHARESREQSAMHRQSDLAETAGRELGDQAGTMVSRGEIRIESWNQEKTTIGAEAGAEE